MLAILIQNPQWSLGDWVRKSRPATEGSTMLIYQPIKSLNKELEILKTIFILCQQLATEVFSEPKLNYL